MMAMIQWLDACGFFFPSHLSVLIFLALVVKVLRNRFGCHGQSLAELAPSKLFNFGHTVPFADWLTTKTMRFGGTAGMQNSYTTCLVLIDFSVLGRWGSSLLEFFPDGAQVWDCSFQSGFAVAHPTWSLTQGERQHVGQVT